MPNVETPTKNETIGQSAVRKVIGHTPFRESMREGVRLSLVGMPEGMTTKAK